MENLVIDTVGDCKIWQGQRQVSKGSVSVFYSVCGGSRTRHDDLYK